MLPEEDNKDKEKKGSRSGGGSRRRSAPVRGFLSTLVLVIRYHDEPYRATNQPFTIVPQSIDPISLAGLPSCTYQVDNIRYHYTIHVI